MQQTFSILKNLLWRDLLLIKKDFRDNFIDMLVWPTTASLVFGRIMPHIAQVDSSFAGLTLLGAIISIIFVNALHHIQLQVTDFEHDRIIDYYLTLPLSSTMVFMKQALSIVLRTYIFGLPLFIIAKLLLPQAFSMATFSFTKFLLMFSAVALFLAFFGLWISSWVRNKDAFIHVWLRMYTPMLWFGGFLFSWQQVHTKLPIASYLMLLNPMTYIMDGLRASMLGQTGFINFWVSFGMLTAQAALFAFIAIRRLQQRLDTV